MHLSNSRSACAAALALLGTLAASASANEGGLSGAPHWTLTAPLADFYQVSTTTRTGFTPCPVVVTIPAPPIGTQIVKVFASWNFMLDGPAPAVDTIGINGNPVAGNLVGQGTPDLSGIKDRGVSFIADGFGQFINFGGANTIQGVCDKALGADPSAFGSGLSILVVYQEPAGTERRVSVWTGYTSSESSAPGIANAVLGLPTPYQGGYAHFFMNALNGLDFVGPNDEFRINGTPVGGLLNGTGAVDDSWQGLAGPNVSSDLYDRVDDSIKNFMTLGDVEIKARTIPLGGVFTNPIGHTFSAFTGIESCGSWETYCTAKVNSLGCAAVVSASGTPSAGLLTTPFMIDVDNVRNKMNGLLFYGYDNQAVPFQGGVLCVAPPVLRTGLVNTGGSPNGDDCTGSAAMDFNAYVQSGVDPLLTAGTTVFAQWWTRDPGDAFGANTSGGIAFDLCQ